MYILIDGATARLWLNTHSIRLVFVAGEKLLVSVFIFFEIECLKGDFSSLLIVFGKVWCKLEISPLFILLDFINGVIQVSVMELVLC